MALNCSGTSTTIFSVMIAVTEKQMEKTASSLSKLKRSMDGKIERKTPLKPKPNNAVLIIRNAK